MEYLAAIALGLVSVMIFVSTRDKDWLQAIFWTVLAISVVVS